APTEPPKKFAPLVIPPQKSNRLDERGAERVNELLDANTPNEWYLSWLEPIEPRKSLSRDGGTVIGWRTRFEFDSSTPYETVFDDMQKALWKIATDSAVMRAFSGRRSMVRCIFRTPAGYEQWRTLSIARVFQVAVKQASSKA